MEYIQLLIYIVVFVAVVMVLMWLLRYMGAPDIIQKIFIVIAVLVVLLMALQFFRHGHLLP